MRIVEDRSGLSGELVAALHIHALVKLAGYGLGGGRAGHWVHNVAVVAFFNVVSL